MATIENSGAAVPTGREAGHVGSGNFFLQVWQSVNKNLFRDGIIILLTQFALLAGLLMADKGIILDPLLQTVLLLYASYTGWSMFEKERQEGAVEYMLSLPVTRTRLFSIKFFPRAAIVLIVLAFYLLLHHLFDFPFILDKFSFSLAYVVFFLVSLAFSLSVKSFFTVFLLTSLLSFGQAFFIKILDRTLSEIEALLQANLAILVFPILFFVLFQFYDIKPVSYFNRKFAPPAFLLTIIIMAVGYFTTGETWNNHTLSKSGSIIRNKCSKTEILKKQENKVKRFKYKGCVLPLMEDRGKNLLYAVRRLPMKGGCRATNLISIDLNTGGERELFEIPEGWYLDGGTLGKIGKTVDNTYYFILQSQERQVQMIMSIGDKVEQIPISGDLHGRRIDVLLHVVKSPRQFFILSEKEVFLVDESGTAEKLFRAEALAPWKDKMLVFHSSGMTLYRIAGEGIGLIPIYKKQGKIQKILRHEGVHETRLVIFKRGREFFMLDLEKEIEPLKINLDFPPFYYMVQDDKYILFHRQPQEIIISELKDGKIIKKEKWQPGIEFEYEQIYISSYGILVYNEKEYEVYSFKK